MRARVPHPAMQVAPWTWARLATISRIRDMLTIRAALLLPPSRGGRPATMTHTQHYEPRSKPDPLAPRDTMQAMGRGSLGKCPACGEGHLYRAFLKVADTCDHCSEELHHQRADDAPAWVGRRVASSSRRLPLWMTDSWRGHCKIPSRLPSILGGSAGSDDGDFPARPDSAGDLRCCYFSSTFTASQSRDRC